jgi:hypothetical protein
MGLVCSKRLVRLYQPNAGICIDAYELFRPGRAKALMDEAGFHDAPQALFGFF